jgi:hypothetical protein
MLRDPSWGHRSSLFLRNFGILGFLCPDPSLSFAPFCFYEKNGLKGFAENVFKTPGGWGRKNERVLRTGNDKGGLKWKTGLLFWGLSHCSSFSCGGAEPEWDAAAAGIPTEPHQEIRKRKQRRLPESWLMIKSLSDLAKTVVTEIR